MTCISITPTLLIIIKYCCGKHCKPLLNRFLIKDLHHILNLLRHLPLSSIIGDKIRPPTSFSTPCGKKFRPAYLFSRPPTYKKSRLPTSILTIRSLPSDSLSTIIIWLSLIFYIKQFAPSPSNHFCLSSSDSLSILILGLYSIFLIK